MTREGAPTSKWPALSGSSDASKAAGEGGTAYLRVRRPDLPEVRVRATSGLVIGRSAALADLVLDDDLVSRRHAQLHIDPRGYFRLEDLDSRNGLRFQGRTVKRLNLVDGDVFHVGKTEFEFSAEMSRLPDRQPEPSPEVDRLLVDADVAVPAPLEKDPGDGLEGIEQLSWKPGAAAPPAEPGPVAQPEASEEEPT